MFKFTRRKQFIALTIWIVITLLAIIQLPGLTHLIQTSQAHQPQTVLTHPESTTKPRQIRDTGSDHTLDLVYSRASAPFTVQQRQQMNHMISRLHQERQTWGLQRLTDVHNAPAGVHRFWASDRAANVIQLQFIPGLTDAAGLRRLQQQTQIPGLHHHLTSPALQQKATTHQDVNITKASALLSLAFVGMILGLLCRSVTIPIISTITILTASLVTLSAASWLASHQFLEIANFTPLTIILTAAIVGTIINSRFFLAVLRKLPRHRDPYHSVARSVRRTAGTASGTGILTAAVLSSPLLLTRNFQLLPSLGITVLVSTLAAWAVNPFLSAQLGRRLAWPGHLPVPHHRFWNHLARFALWQPIVGFLMVACFTAPCLIIYRPHFNAALTNPRLRTAAQLGASQLNTHFRGNAAHPVTVELKAATAFNHEATLKPLDELTTKLQSLPGVTSVASLTQPGGQPLEQDYLRYQLGRFNTQLSQIRGQLKSARHRLRSSQRQSQPATLTNLSRQLHRLQNTDQALTHTQLTTARSSAAQRKASRAKRAEQTALRQIRPSLQQLSANINQAGQTSQQLHRQLQQLKKPLIQTAKQVHHVSQRLNHRATELRRIQSSAAGRDYYITPDQIADTDFQQQLVNFTHDHHQRTQLSIILNSTHHDQQNLRRLKQIRTMIQDQLRNTPLRHARIQLRGLPVQQALIQQHWQTILLPLALIMAGSLLGGLALLSRSLLQPLIWLLCLVSSFPIGLQLTHMLVKFISGPTELNWSTLIDGLGLSVSIMISELVPLSLSYRHRHAALTVWLKDALTQLGQQARWLILITVAGSVGCFCGHNPDLIQLGLISSLTVISFNLILPLMASALGRWSVTLPHSWI